MKLLVLFSCLLVLIGLSLANSDARWSSFKRSNRRNYQSRAEEVLRYDVWQNASKVVEEYNKLAEQGRITFRTELYPDADLTPEEFSTFKTGFRMSNAFSEKNARMSPVKWSTNPASYPASVDWRRSGLVTSVKNQGYCGSCWAFAVAGALEGQFRKRNTQNPSLSVQQMVDCDYTNYACSGGDFATGLRYTTQTSGLMSDPNYPYYGYKKSCGLSQQSVRYKPSRIQIIYSEGDLLAAVATQGPIAIAMYSSAPSFKYYKNGIYDDYNYCYRGYQADHAMLVVGYGSENGIDFWVVKNSWGTSWGEQGYIRIRRGRYTCGIGKYSGYPIS